MGLAASAASGLMAPVDRTNGKSRMRVLLIADIHANLAALRALPSADAILCAGDVVGFGPDAGAVIDELQRLRVRCVRGDEDDAVAKNVWHPVPPSLEHAGLEVRERTREALSQSQMRWLQNLPPELEESFDGVRIGVTHAYPGDYTRYLKPTDEEISRISRAFPHCDIVLLGHTHRSGSWKGRCRIINPGSVGFPQRPGFAAYAVLEKGKIIFGEARYDPKITLAMLSTWSISDEAYGECANELTEGSTRPYARVATAR